MNKVLVIGMTANPGGIESAVMNYYRNIDRNKIQFDFLCNTGSIAYSEEINQLGGNIINVASRSKKYFKYKKEVKSLFKQHSNEYTTIWVNMCNVTNLDYLKYAKKYGIKYRIIHSHNSQNMNSKIVGLVHNFNKKRLKKYATDFWSCGDEAGKWFYDDTVINSDRYLLVNNAIDANKFKYDEKTRKEYRKILEIDDKIVFGNIGRFHFQKNHPFIIKIFNEILKEKPNSVLLLIGQGEDEEKIKEQVKELNIEDKVKFLGIRSDVDKIMQAMDVLLFPSVFEGLPLVLVEAQSSKLLIYTSDVITPKAKFNDRLKFISLDKDEKYWSREIIDNLNLIETRNSSIEDIVEKGFDIKTEVSKLEKYFERN